MAAAHSFHGFQFPTTTPVPDEVFDVLLPKLSGAELKVLLYICRRTFGFKKQWDSISLNQIATGITTKDGRELDRGTGLSKRHVQRALKQLEERQIIRVNRLRDETGLNYINTYSLHFQHPLPERTSHRKAEKRSPEAVKRRAETTAVETKSDLVETEQSRGVETGHAIGVGTADPTGRDRTVPRVETATPTTRNSKQETVIQETGEQGPTQTETTKPNEQERESAFQAIGSTSSLHAWNLTLQRLKAHVPSHTFATWLTDTMLLALTNGVAQVKVPSTLAATWLERRLYWGIVRALRDVLNQDVAVQFVTA
jgi:phage replication O-like protein O